MAVADDWSSHRFVHVSDDRFDCARGGIGSVLSLRPSSVPSRPVPSHHCTALHCTSCSSLPVGAAFKLRSTHSSLLFSFLRSEAE